MFLLYASVDTQGRAFTDDVRQYDWFVMVFIVLAALQLLGGYFLGRRSGRVTPALRGCDLPVANRGLGVERCYK